MTRRAFDLIAAERHATDLAIALAALAYRRWMLTRYAVRDLTRRAHSRKGAR